MKSHIDRKWHNIDEGNWQQINKYYLRSFVYRFLSFLYWTIKAEESIYSFDISQAENEDTLYLKYIKTLKHFFCESALLEDLNYDGEHNTNHFYKDHLGKYIAYLNIDGRCMTFEEFEVKFQSNYDSIKDVVKYITNINTDETNLNYNAIKCFHLFLMLFLNEYGLDYHYTDKKKLLNLMKENYSNIKIKKGYYNFLIKNKVTKQSKVIIKTLRLKASS
ncbi:MAG: hypothetical protein HYZ42_04625 [Bacteroidetes bacterium]|nr:hypothetical protein [Bacteroidota bacterium]